jgi:hypothetical protein
MPIVPDDKDWTWVLRRPCAECGFDASALDAADVADGIRDNVSRWRALLEQPQVLDRPTEDRWSALEYACHVRDVFRLFDERLARMLNEDDPVFASWDQDQTAEEERYGEQDPRAVVAELEVAGARLADHFERVSPGDWQRPGRRSDGATFTIDTFSHYLLHDPVHHVWDVQQGYATLSGLEGRSR